MSMKINEPWTGLDMVCYRCRRRPDQIPEYIHNPEHQDPFAYVWAEEGTLNMFNGHFCCTECYISVGQPSGRWPDRWVAP